MGVSKTGVGEMGVGEMGIPRVLHDRDLSGTQNLVYRKSYDCRKFDPGPTTKNKSKKKIFILSLRSQA